MDRSFADVSRLLAPRSVAVIGASDQPGNIGGAAVRFSRKFGSPSAIYPVSRGRETVAGLRCHPSVADLPSPVDLAILAVPAASVAGLIRECASAGIKAGVVWAGGFVEGGTAGLARQEELASLCRETGFAMLGPNCIGVIDTHAPMIASFASMMLGFDRFLPGNISMISQSGGLATIGLALAQQQGCGFRYMVSTGNEAVLETADFLKALVDDPRTKVIALYLEGARDGAKLCRALRAAREARKPVVVLKAGSTPASASAAAAHTGALVGEGRVWNAMLRDCAAIQVDSLEELLDVAILLSGADLSKLPANRGVAAITFGGGSGVLSADQCDRAGLAVPALRAETLSALAGSVPPLASTRNPVDLTPQSYLDPRWLAHFPGVLDVIAADPGVGTVFFQLGPMSSGEVRMAEMVAAFRERCPKPAVVAWPLSVEAARETLRAQSVHVFPEYSRGVRAMGRLTAYVEALRARHGAEKVSDFDWAAQIPDARAGLVVSEHRCHAVLARAGLPVAAGRLATSERAAIEAARDLAFPLVMKGISDQVTHRAAAGLVELRVKSEAEVRECWGRMQTRAGALRVALEGVYVQHMVEEGIELLVSAFRDPHFGVMLSLGAGGAMTELIDDVVLAPAPLDTTAAAAALERLRIVHHAGGLAMGPDALLEFVVQFAALAAAAPWRRFVLEVNPIKWTPTKITAVDGLLIIQDP